MRFSVLGGLIAGVRADGLATEGFGTMLGFGSSGNESQDRSLQEMSSIGGRLVHQFMGYNTLPMGEAELRAAGWFRQNSVCDRYLGFAWTKEASGATTKHPLKLYTNAAGQAAGVGVIIRGRSWNALPTAQQQWATRYPITAPAATATLAHLDVAFRTNMCTASDSSLIGTTMILNPKAAEGTGRGTLYTIPVRETDAKEFRWHQGSCFDTMGTHYLRDTSTASTNGAPTWNVNNLFPVVAMYHNGRINSIFFASTVNQITQPNTEVNMWEPSPLDPTQMCMNFCGPNCAWTNLNTERLFSTMHIFFNAPSTVRCDTGLLSCKITNPSNFACCPRTRGQSGSESDSDGETAMYRDEPLGTTKIVVVALAGLTLAAVVGAVFVSRRKRVVPNLLELGAQS